MVLFVYRLSEQLKDTYAGNLPASCFATSVRPGGCSFYLLESALKKWREYPIAVFQFALITTFSHKTYLVSSPLRWNSGLLWQLEFFLRNRKE